TQRCQETKKRNTARNGRPLLEPPRSVEVNVRSPIATQVEFNPERGNPELTRFHSAICLPPSALLRPSRDGLTKTPRGVLSKQKGQTPKAKAEGNSGCLSRSSLAFFAPLREAPYKSGTQERRKETPRPACTPVASAFSLGTLAFANRSHAK